MPRGGSTGGRVPTFGVMAIIRGSYRSWKSMESPGILCRNFQGLETVMLTWKIQVSVTPLITHAFVNFLAVRDTKHLKFKVQKFESSSVFRIEEYTVK